jgi:hypothetical protein
MPRRPSPYAKPRRSRSLWGGKKVQQILQSWPAALVICLLIFFILFFAPIANLLGRISRVSLPGGNSIDVASSKESAAQQQDSARAPLAQPTIVPASHALPPPVEVYAAMEAEIRKSWETSSVPQNVQTAWLIRGVAILRVQVMHEIAYRLILGSQIDLVIQSNTAALPDMRVAREIYERARIKYPEIYANFPFEPWLHFPINSGLITWNNVGATQTLVITPLGRDFLHYLVNSGLTTAKGG